MNIKINVAGHFTHLSARFKKHINFVKNVKVLKNKTITPPRKYASR